jgi:UDP-glucose 4-epimerase
MEILVTGGTGYIGSHTVVELINKGYTPIVADNLSNSRIEVIDAIEKITGKKIIFYNTDLCDKIATHKIFEKHSITATIHFAAFKAVGESVLEPLKYYHNNLISLINLLEIYKERKLDNFIFSSSCTVYGQPDMLPVTEATPLKKPESPYGHTKQIGEQILSDAIRSGTFKGISLRYFNPAGSHPSALIGELPAQAPLNLVPVITQTAIGLRKSMTVFGTDYKTPDGTCVRDYIHVVDVANAHISAVERLLNNQHKSTYEIFNLGSGNGNSVLEAIRAFEKASGQKLNFVTGERRPGDVEKVYADTRFAEKELKWKPALTLEDIMRTAWEWEKYLARMNAIKSN